MTENVSFSMHPHLLWDVITKQAGTLAKAVLEGVPNSVDAGASRCEVTIGRNSITIADDGRGFQSKDEILKLFAVFGQPHQEGDAKFGRFRMGRGQMFAFGANTWKSNGFRMDVDLKPQEQKVLEDGGSLAFKLSELKEPVDGCRIEIKLYDKLSPSQIDALKRDVAESVAWMQEEIVLDGKRVSKDPAGAKWTEETDDAWIRLQDKGTLDVYNQGVLVCRMPAYRIGTGGIVVSKKKLDVNFARNDIQSTCQVWKRIEKLLGARQTERSIKKPKLTDAERENLARQFKNGAIGLETIYKLKLLTDVTGTHHAINRFANFSENWSGAFCVSSIGDKIGETALRRGIAFVMDPSTLDRFGVETTQELAKLILDRAKDAPHTYWNMVNQLKRAVHLTPDDLSSVISSTHEPLQKEELTPSERIWLQAAKSGADTIGWRVRGREANFKLREIHAGQSDVSDAWTNGRSSIWISRGRLGDILDGMKGATKLAALILHEYLHDSADTGSHVHDEEFYRRFHDIAINTDVVGQAAEEIVKNAVRLYRSEGRRPTGALARTDDAAASTDVMSNETAGN